MTEYVTKEQVIDWFSSYGHLDKPIPFETLVSDLRCMKAADVEPVKPGRWIYREFDDEYGLRQEYECSECGKYSYFDTDFCPNCGARMDEEVDHAKE